MELPLSFLSPFLLTLQLQSLLPHIHKSLVPSHHILHLSIDFISLLLINFATSEDIHRETLIAAQFFLRLERFT